MERVRVRRDNNLYRNYSKEKLRVLEGESGHFSLFLQISYHSDFIQQFNKRCLKEQGHNLFQFSFMEKLHKEYRNFLTQEN